MGCVGCGVFSRLNDSVHLISSICSLRDRNAKTHVHYESQFFKKYLFVVQFFECFQFLLDLGFYFTK